MPTEQEDQDSYSIDEIMDRLRDRGQRNEPELVTRADGTRAVKVRKRKRRSHQPHKEAERRRQRSRVVQIALVVVLVLGLAGSLVGVFAYYNSRGFTDSLRGKIATWSGAEVDFTQFRVTPVSAGAQTMNCRWGEGNPLREISLQGVSGDLRMTSFVSGLWSGEEVFARSGILRLAAADPAQSSRLVELPEAGTKFPFAFIRYRCGDLTLSCGSSQRKPLQLRKVEASYYILPGAGQLRLNGGVLSVWGWPDLPVERGLVEYRNGQIELSSLRISSGIADDFVADIEGTLDPRSPQPAFLDVRLRRFPLAKLAGDNVGRLLNVTIDSDATLMFVPGEFESYELVAPFTASSGTEGAFVDVFPFLGLLHSEFPEEKIGSRNRAFSTESEGLLRRRAGEIRLERLRLEEKNLLALRGDIRIGENDALSGEIDVGVAERLAAGHGSPNFLKVFSRSRDGYRWATVTLSGTLHRPEDDFIDRVREIVSQDGSGAPGEGPGGRDRQLENEFQDLIRGGSPGR